MPSLRSTLRAPPPWHAGRLAKHGLGSIEASTEDCLFGNRLFIPIRALVNYEDETLDELRTAFSEAVDDYLAT